MKGEYVQRTVSDSGVNVTASAHLHPSWFEVPLDLPVQGRCVYPLGDVDALSQVTNVLQGALNTCMENTGQQRPTKVNIDTQVNKDQYGHKGQQWVGNGQYRSVKVNMGDTISQQRSIEVNNGHMSMRVIVCYVFEM